MLRDISQNEKYFLKSSFIILLNKNISKDHDIITSKELKVLCPMAMVCHDIGTQEQLNSTENNIFIV